MDYLAVSKSYPELYQAVKKIFKDSEIRSIEVISADMGKVGNKNTKNHIRYQKLNFECFI